MFKEVHVDGIEKHAGAPQIKALLAQYRALSIDEALPSYRDFNPERLPEHAPNLAVVEPIGGGDYLYVYYGRSIFETSGVEMLGSKVSQWKSEVGTFFCEAYDRAVAELRPIYTLHRAHHAIRVHLWERLVLPVRYEDRSLRLVVFNKPREYLDDLLRGARCDTGRNSRAPLHAQRFGGDRRRDRHHCERAGGQNLWVLDQPILKVVPKLRASATWHRYLEVVETRASQRFETTLKERGVAKWLDVKVVPLGDGLMLSIADITELKNACEALEAKNTRLAEEVQRRQQLEGELRRLAEVDVLTGVASRRAFMDAAECAINAASERRPLAVIALDVDYFQRINDRYGHLAGDKVLKAVGEELKAQCRAHDVVGRLGGEEFAVLLPQTTLEAGIAVAERMRERLLARVVPITAATRLQVTASFGVAVFVHSDTSERLLARADAGLYRAKSRGRNCVLTVQAGETQASQDVGRESAA